MELLMNGFNSGFAVYNDAPTNILEFSFVLEDKGPGVAWKGGAPIIQAVARSVNGQLLVKGIIYEEGAEVPSGLVPVYTHPTEKDIPITSEVQHPASITPPKVEVVEEEPVVETPAVPALPPPAPATPVVATTRRTAVVDPGTPADAFVVEDPTVTRTRVAK